MLSCNDPEHVPVTKQYNLEPVKTMMLYGWEGQALCHRLIIPTYRLNGL